MSAAPTLPSEVSILKTKAAAKKGTGVDPEGTEVTWPKPQFVRPSLAFKGRDDLKRATG
jgi:hypothetical protein